MRVILRSAMIPNPTVLGWLVWCVTCHEALTGQFVRRQVSQLQRVDTCSDAFAGTLLHRTTQMAKQHAACAAVGNWGNVVTSFAPEHLVITSNSLLAMWHLPWLHTAHWDYLSYLLHTLGKDDVEIGTLRGLDCTLLFQFALVFKTLVTIIAHGAWDAVNTDFRYIVGEFTDEASPSKTKAVELMQQIAVVLTGDLVDGISFSLFGLLQWLGAVLKFQRRRERRQQEGRLLPCRLLPKSGAANRTSIAENWRVLLEELVSCLVRRQLYDKDQIISKPLAWILTLGQQYWGPLHIAMAAASGQEPYLLPLPQAKQPEPQRQRAPQDLPLVELCATARQQHELHKIAGHGTAPIATDTFLASSSQRDGARLTVVAVATGLRNGADSARPTPNKFAYLLEFLIYAEKPRGECTHRGRCQDKNRTLYTCGPHAAILPEVSMRKWRCIFHSSTEPQQDASAVSFFRQAATIRCPVPSDVSLENFSKLQLQADPPYEGARSWRIPVEVCRKRAPDAAEHLSCRDCSSGTEKCEEAACKVKTSTRRLAICMQPAWDMIDLERRVPGLVRTFLRYYRLLGAESFTFYDCDGSFAQHPEIIDLLAAGKLKYFPRFMKAVSQLLDEAWNRRLVKGLTGSRASFMQELMLNHCVLNYRGSADLVLLGDKDVFLAFGPSVPVSSAGCWPEAARTQSCCSASGRDGREAGCWTGSRSFPKCCMEYLPQKAAQSPWQAFVEGHSPSFWRAVGTVAMSVCEFIAPASVQHQQDVPDWAFSSHLWRPRKCESQHYHLVNPWRFMSQNSEWVRLRPGSVRYYADSETVRALHLVNLHGTRWGGT